MSLVHSACVEWRPQGSLIRYSPNPATCQRQWTWLKASSQRCPSGDQCGTTRGWWSSKKIAIAYDKCISFFNVGRVACQTFTRGGMENSRAPAVLG
jgi:hypothetical protein